jgi:hypothetical protein
VSGILPIHQYRCPLAVHVLPFMCCCPCLLFMCSCLAVHVSLFMFCCPCRYWGILQQPWDTGAVEVRVLLLADGSVRTVLEVGLGWGTCAVEGRVLVLAGGSCVGGRTGVGGTGEEGTDGGGSLVPAHMCMSLYALQGPLTTVVCGTIFRCPHPRYPHALLFPSPVT